MIKSKKQMFTVIGAFFLVMMLTTVTYAFFNYTRTGSSNTIRTGRIAFNSEQGTAINLTNLFPIDPTATGIMNDNTKVGTVIVNVTGDTTYSEGIEYLVSAVNVTNTVGSGNDVKTLPISIQVSVESNTQNDPATTLGTEDEEYFEKRGENASYYKVLASEAINEGEELLVGYIAPGATGVDGNIVIKAYLDANKIAISDTYPEQVITHTEGEEPNQTTVTDYTNGTTSTWANGREVFTTTEWNSLQTNGVSFQVKVEANEGTWVEENRSVNAMITLFNSGNDIEAQKANIKEVYFSKMGATRMQNAYDAATIKADLTYNNEGKVLAWLEVNEDDNTKYNLIIASDGDTYLTTGEAMFYRWSNLEKVVFGNVNSSRATYIPAMFSECSSLVSIDLSNFGNDNVNDMIGFFSGCTSLEEINMSGFNFGKATIPALFSGLTSLKSINLSNANMSQVKYVDSLFSGCTSLTSVDLSGLGGNSIISAGGMFSGCTNLREINMSGFNFGSASTSGLFSTGLTSLEVVDLSNAIINTTNMTGMFANASSLETIYVSNTWNVDNVTMSSDMFDGCTSLVGGNGTTFDSNHIDKEYARIDGGQSNPGYFTLKTN